MSDLTDRLWAMHSDLEQGAYYTTTEDPEWDAISEAADRIEELEAKVARLESRGINDMQHRIAELEAELRLWASDDALLELGL